ncbi:MAG: hypothetical protein GEU79_13905 [Acidimicrobiia bacterium]|nr:hypothetical protein [Acidimicrobiia bacterium]
MSELTTHAAWTLVVAYGLSLGYEVYRATAKTGVSEHDSIRSLLRLSPLYLVAGAVIALLFAGVGWAAWLGLVFTVVMILVSIFYYNPRMMLERDPGPIDWAEDLIYTGLLFVAAALLAYEVIGATLG